MIINGADIDVGKRTQAAWSYIIDEHFDFHAYIDSYGRWAKPNIILRTPLTQKLNCGNALRLITYNVSIIRLLLTNICAS